MTTKELYNSLYEVGHKIYKDAQLDNIYLNTQNPIVNAMLFTITSLNVDHNIDFHMDHFDTDLLPDEITTTFDYINSIGLDIVDYITEHFDNPLWSDCLVAEHDKIILQNMKQSLPKMVEQYNLDKKSFADWPLWMQDFISDGFENLNKDALFKDRKQNAEYKNFNWDDEETKQSTEESENIIVLNGVRYKKVD